METISQNPLSSERAAIQPNERLYSIVVSACYGTYFVALIAGLWTWNTILLSIPLPFGKQALPNGLEFNLGFWFIVPAIGHFAISVFGSRELGMNEYGVAYFFGVPVRLYLSPGLKFIPWGVITLDRLSRSPQIIHIPSPNDTTPWPRKSMGDASVLQIRTRAEAETAKGPLSAEIVVSLAFFAIWYISNPIVFRARVQDARHAYELLYNICITSINSVIGTSSARELHTNQEGVALRMLDMISRNLPDLGMTVRNIGLINIKLPEAIVRKIDELTAAEIDKNIQIAQATGQSEAMDLLTPAESRSIEAKIKGELEGRAAGYKAIQVATGASASEVITSETARASLEHANTVIVGVPGGLTEALGALVSGRQTQWNRKDGQPHE